MLPELRSSFIDSLDTPSHLSTSESEVSAFLNSQHDLPCKDPITHKKRILIVGPSFHVNDNSMATNVDIVVQINNSLSTSAQYFNHLPIITYLNGDFLYRNNYDIGSIVSSNLVSLRLKPATILKPKFFDQVTSKYNIHCGFCSDLPETLNYFQTPFNLVYILFDLLRSSPTNIYLSGFDLRRTGITALPIT